MAIASGKGGTGKTLVATNLYHALFRQKHKVVLVDCDAEAPNARLFFKSAIIKTKAVTQSVPLIDESSCSWCGRCDEYCHYNAIFYLPSSKVIKLMEDLCHGCGACSVACHYGAITEKERLLGQTGTYSLPGDGLLIEARMNTGIYSPVPLISAAIGESANAPLVIMDAPPGTSCPFIQTVERADFVVLVTEPTPFGLSDLKQSVETLKTMHKNHGVIINRAQLGNREIYQYLEAAQIPLLMEIPFDRTIARSYARGELLVESESAWQSKFLNLFDNILFAHGNSHHQR